MPIVSNTSPLLNLAIVDHLSLMHEQFGEILIPQAVFEELRVEEGLPGSQSIREAKLQSLKSAMDDLRKKAGFHIASELYSYVLKKGGEKYG